MVVLWPGQGLPEEPVEVGPVSIHGPLHDPGWDAVSLPVDCSITGGNFMGRVENIIAGNAVDEIVSSFEAAWLIEGETDLAEFLPEPGDSIRKPALLELVKVDLRIRRDSGWPRLLEDYLREFPELEGGCVEELALSEYRLRLESGEPVSPEEYQARYAIDTLGWPKPGEKDRGVTRILERSSRETQILGGVPDLTKAASLYLDFRSQLEATDSDTIDTWTVPKSDQEATAVQVFRDLHRSDPNQASKLARAVIRLPGTGETFLGFKLLGELGRGAFGRVYLASQGDLADRPVALKVSAQNSTESQTLAQLQHTNIVPIFSAHRVDPLHAVCMPYFGSTTLRDIFEELEDQPSIPTSGQSLLETLASHQKDRSTLLDSWRSETTGSKESEPPKGVTAEPLSAGPLPKLRLSSDTLSLLSKLTYVDAILWIGARLADGLAHAHGRGIIHRDLKPANILMTDSGQPMLLDFNLSEDTKKPASVVLMGGTLPYMAPEQLRGYSEEKPVELDARSDLYSLGIILYELLAGRHPFPSHSIFNKSVLTLMIAERSNVPAGLREQNKQVSPAVESIVKHCLEPDPARRYQSAGELLEDLERQLADLPLKHAPEPSIRERSGKWARRHPRLTSPTSLVILLGLMFLGVFLGMFAQAQRQAKLEASASLIEFRKEALEVRHLLYSRFADRDRRALGVGLGLEALGRYGVLANPAWKTRPLVTALDPTDRQDLLEEIGAVLLFLARAGQLDAELLKPEDPTRKLGLEAAIRFCDVADGCFEADRKPRALLEQRAELVKLMGQEAEAVRLMADASKRPLKTALDHEIKARTLAIEGEFRKAIPLAQEATRLDPRDFWAWFTLGHSYDRLGQYRDAAACFGTCIALLPDSEFGWYSRGDVMLERNLYDEANRDFDRASALKPDWPDPYVERGISKNLAGKPAEAVKDFTKAMELGETDTRIYFLRATAREKAGDAEGARLDREEGFKREPRSALSWTARAMSREPKDPAGALADLDEALKLNPRSYDALQNKAYILSERLNRIEEAEAVVDRAVTLYPDYVPTRSGRGVLRAILGRREAAHLDARESIWRDTSPKNLYQVAGIYAVTSKQVPDDRIEAFRLLSTALRNGFGFELLDEDHELDAIRDLPEFRKLLDAAKALRDADPQAKPLP
jgi:serine/threonine protein kinase/Flp pilus assembly protein TadD